MSVLRNTGIRIALKWLVTALIIGAVLLFVDGTTLLREIARIPPAAVIAGLALGVGQVFLSAWRWRYTVTLLGLPIPYMQAVREYYLATFTNQVLPGGVLGDVNRALRHGVGSNDRLAAAHGVVIERLSGQVVLVVASYLAVSLVLANGAGYLVSLPSAAVVAALCSLLLLSMVIPVTVSGWGVREGAAVILWPMAGLPAEQGVALSVAYGALIFVSSLPGALFLFSSPVRQR